MHSLYVKKVSFGFDRIFAALLLGAASLLAVAPVVAQTIPAAEHYALIVNGDDSFTHNENVAIALAALPHLGYAPGNTYLLAPDSAAKAADPAAAPAWHRRASDAGLRQAVAQLQRRLRPGDELLVYLTGHGFRLFGRTSLGLQSGTITANELMKRIGELPFGRLVLVADPCYSGGFVNAAIALGRNTVAVASTDDLHEVRCEPFVRPFWIAASAAPDVTVEAAFHLVEDSLAQGGGAAAGDRPQYATSGSCAGHSNSFSTDNGGR
jgi:hypothetical protein